MLGLTERPRGWSWADVERELGVGERTLARYVKMLRAALVDRDGESLVAVVARGDRRFLRLRDQGQPPSSNAYQALSFYFASSVLQFLDGTILKDDMAALWSRFYALLPPDVRRRLGHLEHKFYTVPYLVKDYAGCDEVIGEVLKCLVDQRTMRVEYASPWRDDEDAATPHLVDPYTLALYRGGLYVLGRSHKHRKLIYLAVERLRAVERLPATFAYPPGYSPERHTEGTFGIVEGPETRVELLIHSPEGAALLKARRIHRTQRFVARADGTTLLTMTVRGTAELANWILSLGPHVEVLAPATLRAEVGAALRRGAARYRARR
ncbi:MAG: WYL domain-containing protein [bacterium]|nr:WYL domain-containing protein [bacterium]